jgi:hypothetical protein
MVGVTMKHHKFSWIADIFLVNVLLILIGCAVISPAPTPSSESLSDVSTVVASRTSVSQTPLPTTQTATPGMAFTSTSTSTARPVTATSTPQPQPIATVTSMAISTPPGSEIERQVLWLYETNNGCQLPCWWGITPGQTEWSVAEEFFQRFDEDIYETFLTSGLVYYGVSIPLPKEVFFVDHAELGVLVRDGIVEGFETNVSIGDTPPRYLGQYTISTFLTKYGGPTEVWLSAYSSPPGGGAGSEGVLPFSVVVFYPEQGIVASYSNNGVRQGDFVQGCPQENPVSYLVLMPPDINQTFKQAAGASSAFNREYLSLEEATGMDVATFYETFKNPDNTTCLETSANLWR